MQKIEHPNVVSIYEVGQEGHEPFIALEYFPDGSLDDRMKRSAAMSEREALRFIIEAANGLAAAFEQGIIHRDIKPKNLFITSDHALKVGDFGLAHLADAQTLTQSGEMFGTPHYMSPEIIRGERATWLSDQYALGVTLYEMLTGSHPYPADAIEAVVYRHLHAPVPDARRKRKDVSQETAVLARRMMAKRPNNRFESYETMISALGRAIDSLPETPENAEG